MKNASNVSLPKRICSRFIGAIKSSLIISSLDKLCIKIYNLLCGGFFARLLCGSKESSGESRGISFKKESFISRMAEKLSRKIENSSIVSFAERTADAVFGLRLRVIGTFLMTFAALCIMTGAVKYIIFGNTASLFYALGNGVSAIVMSLVAFPLLISKNTLSAALRQSSIFTAILNILGFSTDKLWSDEVRGKHWPAFLFGCIAGLSSIIIDPFFVFAAITVVAVMFLILSIPEFGVVGLAFLMPFVPTGVLAGLTIFVAIAFFFKLIRGKRVINFQLIDFFVATFVILLLFGGLVSHSPASIGPALLFVCFISVYFIVSCCIRSEKWLNRIVAAMIVSAALVAIYGIFQYAFGTFKPNAWLDYDFFDDIAGRATSTIKNPNMLGEYLILMIPMALTALLSGNKSAVSSRKLSFLCLATMTMCLILTWSRGAWLGFIFSVVIFLLMWSKRSIWFFAIGVFALPALPFVLPDSIINRFTSIGNLADSSTSYRVGIWRGAVHMLEDNFFSGIGIGKPAWYQLYPEYTLHGIEAAPHSHNLFIQIALELGIFGLIVFLCILVLLLRYSFKLFMSLTESSDVISKKDSSTIRLTVAGPLCGLAAVLLQGVTDYSWCNYRVYFIFWLVLALIPAYVKLYFKELDSGKKQFVKENTDTEADMDIHINVSGKNSAE